ncbi:XcyI family restriction endonuclease [Algoriphagus sp.]|uniref:XcyI family restriction endonuclease n=1 Tax=Algoriphagus sp. TaxID=1872435 RepID=UPI003919233D
MKNQALILSTELQINFFYRLKLIKEQYFKKSLTATVSVLDIEEINSELSKFINKSSLNKLAAHGLRGELFFSSPIILKTNPYLLGYYRLLYGFSQKEFFSKGPFGGFKLMEEKGILSKTAASNLEFLCETLAKCGENIVNGIDEFTFETISDLQLLTLGPQFRGSRNNEYGQIASQKIFYMIKEIVSKNIINSTPNKITLINDTGREVEIAFSADPDIEITEKLLSQKRGLISIEIKGGRDYSNIHNRIGEAEKSHQKAKKRGYFEFMTILSVEIDYLNLRSESPTTSHFFNLDKILDNNSSEFLSFRDILTSIISIK